MVDPASALVAAKPIDEAVGLVQKLVGKLRAQPDIAAVKLSAALDEILKTYRVVDEAITKFLMLAFDDALVAKSEQMVSLAGGGLVVHVTEGRGHCHEIDRIRRQHLDRWFERAFNQDEQLQMGAAFDTLGNADGGLFEGLTDVAKQLTAESDELVDLVIAGRVDEARARVRATHKSLREVQRAIAQGMVRLSELKDQFMDMAAAS